MASLNKRIALKPYLERVEDLCRELSRDELIALVLSLAGDESSSGRAYFLSRLQHFLPGKNLAAPVRSNIETLVEDVQALEEAIMERIEAIEDGDYGELEDWDWQTADYDDAPEVISDRQMDDLADLFNMAGDLFLNGDIRDARDLYHALFDLLNEVGECDYAVPAPPAVDLREARARFARCAYETADENQRVNKFAAAMEITASSRFDEQKIDEAYPLLQDVMDAGKQDMTGLQNFYPLWERFLRERGCQGRPASLLAEVVCSTKGLAGLGELAKEWGPAQPYGYLFWLDRLRQETRWMDIIAVARDALTVLEVGTARETVSDFLVEAAKMTGDPALVLAGNLEKLYSHPCDASLKALLTEAVRQDQRMESLAQVLRFYEGQGELSDNEKSMYVKTLLLAGHLDTAWELVKKGEALGWSYGLATGMVFASIAAVASGFHEGAGTIRQLMIRYCGESSVYSYRFSVDEDDQAGFFTDEIIKGLRGSGVFSSQVTHYTKWAFKIGRKRVDDIVSNTHRSAYQRAAWVLGSLAEISAAQEDGPKAEALIYEYCKEKYNRHTAFKREVRQVISESALLRRAAPFF